MDLVSLLTLSCALKLAAIRRLEFERSLARVTGMLDLSADELDRLRGDLHALAESCDRR